MNCVFPLQRASQLQVKTAPYEPTGGGEDQREKQDLEKAAEVTEAFLRQEKVADSKKAEAGELNRGQRRFQGAAGERFEEGRSRRAIRGQRRLQRAAAERAEGGRRRRANTGQRRFQRAAEERRRYEEGCRRVKTRRYAGRRDQEDRPSERKRKAKCGGRHQEGRRERD